MPNPDGTMTPAERQAALLGTAGAVPTAAPTNGAPIGGRGTIVAHDTATAQANKAVYDAQIAAGQRLDGRQTYNADLGGQNELFGNLDNAQAEVKQQGDFGLGTNNNAATAAMLGNAGATADAYSRRFNADANRAGELSTEAGARGLGAYTGDTTQYDTGLKHAQSDRNLQTGAYEGLLAFANQQPGPSAAQAQLTQATDANTQNALALARSGRGMGGGGAGLRQAIQQNALTQQQAAGQMGELRANENTAFQNQRLNAITGAGSIAGQTVQADQGTAASGLAGAQYHTTTALQGTQLNDAASQAWAAQQQGAQQQALGAEMGGQTQQLNINASALAGRESEWASANQTHGIDSGNATTAGIADANRQQAYIGAGTSAAGGVISAAVSDERYKTGITPLSAAPASTDMVLPSKAATDAAQTTAKDSAIGGTAGSVTGGVAGSAVGGPVGGIVGSTLGGMAGKALGKVFSDVRSKTAVVPLSAVGSSVSAAGNSLQPKGAFGDLQALAAKYGAGGVATDPKQADKYAKVPTARFADVKGDAAGIFSRSTDHPILSKGDALIADSARGAPPSMYKYKDPADGTGTYVSPMAQDLAKSPVTAPAVGADPNGKLYVDGPRAALAALSQNHSQQNQLDALYAMLDDSKKKELQRSSSGLDAAGNPYMQAGAR
jgi:hypothetical protein